MNNRMPAPPRRRAYLEMVLVFLGIMIVMGSLAVAYLDSLGYWNYPKGFQEAFLMNRRDDPVGFGIEGLQLFHYFIAGNVLLSLGGLLASKSVVTSRRSLHTFGSKLPGLPENINQLSAKIASLERERENLRQQLSKFSGRPSLAICYTMLAIGALSLVSAVIISHSVLAFIGLGLVLWGALLKYVRPAEYVRIDLLTATAIPLLTMVNDNIVKSGVTGEAVYLPPRHLNEMKGGTVYIGKDRSINPGGVYLSPPGLELANLYEESLNVSFAHVDLDYLQMNLPNLFVDVLEIARKMKMRIDGNRVMVRIEGSVYGNLCQQIRKSIPAICDSIGCPLVSSIALAIARATANRVVVEENRISEDGQTIDVNFRLLGRDQPTESIEAAGAISPRFSRITRLLTGGLFLLVVGACILAWVLYLVWYDIAVWSKDLGTILLGSRTGEAISLGIGMKLFYYLLVSVLFLFVGFAMYIVQRRRTK